MAKKRVTRKQLLKEPDEFITTTGKLIRWAKEHQNQLIYGGATLIGLVIVTAVWGFYQDRRNQTATTLYSQAMATYEASGGEAAPVKALAAARADFTQLVENYASLPAGRMGRIMYGHFSLAGKDLDEAVAQYKAAMDDFSGEAGVLNLIRNGLAMTYYQKGEYAAAIAQFEKLAQSDSPVLKPAALFHLGHLFDQLDRSEESQKIYQQLHSDFPQTSYAQLVKDKIVN